MPSGGYDRYGNLLTINVSKCSAPSLSLGINAKNQVINSGFNYDASGNETGDGFSTYAWDAEGRMTSGAGVTYTFDGAGKRVKDSSPKLYWYGQGGSVLAETDTSGNAVNEYMFFGGMRIARRDSSGNVYYYFANALGSAAIATVTGGVCYDADFYPFGGELAFTNTCAQNYKFAGMEQDSPSGLDRTIYRQYSSNYGRWLSPDPLGTGAVSLSNPQTWNMYAYVTNNPTNLVDPLGLDSNCYGGQEALYAIYPCDHDTFNPYDPLGRMGEGTMCFDGGLCRGTNGVPMIYDASYNGQAPTIAYLQGLNYQGMASFVTYETLDAYNNPLPSGLLDQSPNPGYQGGGEIDLGQALYHGGDWDMNPGEKVGGISVPIGNSTIKIDYYVNQFSILKENKAPTITSYNASTACSARYSQVMSAWAKALKAWLNANPRQQPPPAIANPPVSPTCTL